MKRKLNLIETLPQKANKVNSDFLSCREGFNLKIMDKEKNLGFKNLKIFKSVTQNPTESCEMQVLEALWKGCQFSFFPLAWRP